MPAPSSVLSLNNLKLHKTSADKVFFLIKKKVFIPEMTSLLSWNWRFIHVTEVGRNYFIHGKKEFNQSLVISIH